MDFWQIIMTPFSWLLKVFCQFTDSYGLALILFTIVVKVILFPLSLKGKKSMIKMNLANGELQKIKERCGNDRERYNQEVQKYYSDNNISPMGGCGWSMIPLVILMPLYAIIRRPMKYMMRLTEEGTKAVAKALGWAGEFSLTGAAGAAGRSAAYNELTLAAMMNAENLSSAKNAVTAAGLSAASLFVINFNFLGIDLAAIPQLKFWENGWNWGSIGLFLLPVISAVLSFVSMLVSQKTNRMNKNDNTAAAPANKSMMFISPLISLWIGFTLPAGLCIYWIANSALMMLQEWLCGIILRKDYEAAAKAMEEQARKAKEEEKERRRQAVQRKYAAQEANKGKKNQPKPQTQKKVDNTASREGLRSNARGRAYDPNRYPTFEYHDPSVKAAKPVEEEPLTEEEKELLAESGITVEETPVTAPAEEGYEEAYAPDSEDETPNA